MSYILFVSMVFVIYYFLKHLLHLWRMEIYVKNIKSMYRLVPVLGTAYGFFGKTPSQTYKECLEFFENHETPVKVYLGSTLVIMIDKPEDVKIVLTSDDCLDKPFIFDFFPLPTGIFTARSSSVWKPYRKLVNPAFNPKVLKSFIPMINRKARGLAVLLNKEIGNGEFDILPYMNWNAFDSICATAMDHPLEYRQNQDFFKSMDIYFGLITKRFTEPWNHFDCIYKWTNAFKEGQHHFQKVASFVNKIYEEAKKCHRSNANENEKPVEISPQAPQNFIKQMLRLNSNKEIDDKSAKEQMLTILIGGTDTTASTLSFVISMLAIHPKIQERCFKELESIFTTQDEETSYDQLRELPYLECCLKETMRLFPITPSSFRSSTKDVQLSNCVIPKDTTIMMSIFSLHRRKDIWGADAGQFNPDRFLKDNIRKQDPFSFIPFSAGQRNCIGHRYAMISMKIILATILRNFKFTTDLKMNDFDLRFEMILRLNNKHLVCVERRAW